MKRFRNYGLWVSIFSLIGLILQTYNLFDRLGLTNESYQEIVKAILTVLVLAGIISNPKEGLWFKDNTNDK